MEKQALDLGMKRMIAEGMMEEQERMLEVRRQNIELLEAEERAALPKNLQSSLERS